MPSTVLNAGLCGSCAHVREIRSARGARFLLCGRHREDPRYRKYPSLPVHVCPGHVQAAS